MPPPACVQLTTMLPEPSGAAEKLLLVQESVALNVGIGAANPADATAAASTRLIERFICMITSKKNGSETPPSLRASPEPLLA